MSLPPHSPSAFRFHEAPTQPGMRRGKLAETESSLVLVVDDDEDARFIYTQSLEHLGYRAASEPSGEKGVEAAVRLRPDAILMDVAMPGIDGIEATRRIKADPRTQGCLVIVVTASGTTMFDAARAAGSDAYFCKPFNAFALDSVLRMLSAVPEPPKRSRTTVIKRCGCGRRFTRDQWLALPLCGRMHSPRGDATIELRNCACGSSLGVAIDAG